ncbi:hypothetical protein HU751_003520 [Pseudomonas sp. BW13M1]|uniref:Uncharacterized protein n=1 Tax=Pseudomonas peradeniyensis TaxID=2745488 RepID=A0A923JYG1_9PSED|nr:hypothetical protein [Pseudomonas peradeniyensis]MBV4503905.1 hypothetical protein [Pseudomonas peradeniyensis]
MNEISHVSFDQATYIANLYDSLPDIPPPLLEWRKVVVDAEIARRVAHSLLEHTTKEQLIQNTCMFLDSADIPLKAAEKTERLLRNFKIQLPVLTKPQRFDEVLRALLYYVAVNPPPCSSAQQEPHTKADYIAQAIGTFSEAYSDQHKELSADLDHLVTEKAQSVIDAYHQSQSLNPVYLQYKKLRQSEVFDNTSPLSILIKLFNETLTEIFHLRRVDKNIGTKLKNNTSFNHLENTYSVTLYLKEIKPTTEQKITTLEQIFSTLQWEAKASAQGTVYNGEIAIEVNAAIFKI